METRVVYNNKPYKMLDQYGYKFSSNEVTFNDITIDFTDCTIADIPYKYQEIKIMKADTEENILNGTVLFTGFLDEVRLSEMKLEQENRELVLTLLSPLKMATRRNVTLYGTFQVEEAIRKVLQPLIDDGFVIKEMNVGTGQITTSFVLKTVEDCMNTISSRRNIFWTINEKKEIFVNFLDYLFGLNPAKVITGKEQGLLRLQPSISSTEYANVINFKNVRLIYEQTNSQDNSGGYPIVEINKTIKNGDVIDFINPVIIDEDFLRAYIEQVEDSEYEDTSIVHAFDLGIEINQDIQYFTIGIQRQDTTASNYNKFVVLDGSITFNTDGGDEGTVVLQRDNFFSNLITGFKWNGGNAKIYSMSSATALRYTTMRFMHSAEIEKCKGIISDSGQVEASIDLQSKWFFLNDLTDYARSLIIQNSNIVNEVTMEIDIETGLKIGDIVQIDRPAFLIQGNFAISDISYSFKSELEQKWTYTLKNADMFTTYIDLFRKQEQEENADTISTVILSEFIDEQINEIHEYEIEGKNHTLNFNL